MRLKEYCEEYGCTYKKLAEKWGIHYPTLYYVVQGYGCTYENMEKIIKGSKGKVTFEDLKPMYKAKTRNRRLSDKETNLISQKDKEKTPKSG